jgi:hypothetical protein
VTRNRILGSPYEQQLVTTDVQTVAHVDRYLVFTPDVPLTVTLDPNAFDGDQVTIVDAAGNAGTYPITITVVEGQAINGASIINTNLGSVTYTFHTALEFLLSGNGFWTAETSSGSGVSTAARQSIVGPSALLNVPTSDGDAAVMLTLPTITAPVGSLLTVNGYLQISNGSGDALNIQVKVETTAGGGSVLVNGLFTKQLVSAATGFQNVPVVGDLVTTTEETTLLICAFATGSGITAAENGSFVSVTQVG